MLQADQDLGFSFPVAALTHGSPHCPRWLPPAHHHMPSSSPNKGIKGVTKNVHTSHCSRVPDQNLVIWPLCALLIWDGIAPSPGALRGEVSPGASPWELGVVGGTPFQDSQAWAKLHISTQVQRRGK